MAYHELNKGSGSKLWKDLPDKNMHSTTFYPLQKGRGGVIMSNLPPMQGIIEKAKVKLRRQVKKAITKKKTQSRVSKRRGKTAPKSAPQKKKKPKPRKKTAKPKSRKKRTTKSKK